MLLAIFFLPCNFHLLCTALVKLENVAEKPLRRFKCDRIKASPGKYNLLVNNDKKSF